MWDNFANILRKLGEKSLSKIGCYVLLLARENLSWKTPIFSRKVYFCIMVRWPRRDKQIHFSLLHFSVLDFHVFDFQVFDFLVFDFSVFDF